MVEEDNEPISPRPLLTRRRIGLIGLFCLTLIGAVATDAYYFDWRWTGFGPKTLWDWMSLLVVPIALATLGVWLNRRERERDQRIADQKRKADQLIADDQMRATVLDTYFDRMSELLLTEKLVSSDPSSEVRKVARARTLAALRRLNPALKA